jgi:hypothetical protein
MALFRPDIHDRDLDGLMKQSCATTLILGSRVSVSPRFQLSVTTAGSHNRIAARITRPFSTEGGHSFLNPMYL